MRTCCLGIGGVSGPYQFEADVELVAALDAAAGAYWSLLPGMRRDQTAHGQLSADYRILVARYGHGFCVVLLMSWMRAAVPDGKRRVERDSGGTGGTPKGPGGDESMVKCLVAMFAPLPGHSPTHNLAAVGEAIRANAFGTICPGKIRLVLEADVLPRLPFW